MPRNATILSIFVASPSDVLEERRRLDDIVTEVNSLLAKLTSVRLEVLKWERDAPPAFDEDPQAAINRQIPQDYDIFVGILWHRIGSPTRRAESGTIEEFNLAKARFDEDTNSVRLMMYFKDAGISTLTVIDPDQLKQVNDFRSRVSEEGGLYFTFTDAENFARQVQIHLMQHVIEWSKQNDALLPINPSEPPQESHSVRETDGLKVRGIELEDLIKDNSDDLIDEGIDDGLLDLEEQVEEEFSGLFIVLQEMGEALSDVGSSIKGRSDALQSLIPEIENKIITPGERKRIRTRAKGILNDASRDMNNFVLRMEAELPSYKQHLNEGLGAFTKAIPIYLEINEDRSELKNDLTKLLDSMDSMLENMKCLHNSVHGLPRVTSAFAKSRRETERALQDVIDVTNGARTSLVAGLSLLP